MDPVTIFHKRIQQYDSVYPNLRKYLSQNPNITLEMVLEDIKQNPSKKDQWIFENLCGSIPFGRLIEHNILPNKNSDRPLYHAKGVNFQDILKYKHLFNMSWMYVTAHPCITIHDIANHPDFPWDYSTFCYNKSVKLEHVKQYPQLPWNDDRLYSKLSYTATYQEIMAQPDKPWASHCLSHMSDVQEIKHLMDYFMTRDKGYDTNTNYIFVLYGILSYNPYLHLKDYIELFHTDTFRYASRCKNLTVEDFLNHPNEDWDILQLSNKLPIEFILQTINDYAWDWTQITFNKHLRYEDLDKLIQGFTDKMDCEYIEDKTSIRNCMKQFVLEYSLQMPYIDRKMLYEELLSDCKKTQFGTIVKQPFFLEPTFEEMRQYFAGKRVVRRVVECISNPEYEQCRKRLKREHSMLT